MVTPDAAARPSLWQSLFGFSRGLQATLSISQPALAAVVALRGLPGPGEIILGLIAATAGYYAVFAVNDLLDVEVDRRRFDNLRSYEGFDVDSAAVRHPLAQGFLTYRQGIAWIALLSVIALVAAFLLNPMAALLFVTAAGLEIIYCSLLKVTAWKFLPTGLMVAVGAVAGWFAVVPLDRVEWLPLSVFFVWMFAWEIGGRNIVNDWSDVEEDQLLGIKTVPVVYGFETAGRLIFGFLLVTFFAGILLGLVANLGWIFVLAAIVEGWYALIGPGIRLLREPTPQRALALFNRASFYPMVMFPILLISLYLPKLWGG